jgi:hypothetical protein
MSPRGGARELVLALIVAAAVLSGTVCSVDNDGLSNLAGQGGVGGGTGGAAGHGGASGTGGGTGGSLTGTGGLFGTGGATGGNPGTGGLFGTGGATGGSPGSGGASGTGGLIGTGGAAGGGGSATGGASGSGGQSGSVGTGGVAGSGAGGTGGVAGGGGEAGGMGGEGGVAGSGTGGTGGVGGSSGGHGGNHPPDCSTYPTGMSLMLTTDNKLHCYWVHGNEVDWNSAETICENEGGTLVTILSSTENMFVLHMATQANLFTMGVPVAIGATDGKAANDDSGPGDYAWVTGEAWGYTNWHSGEPSGSCSNCGGPGPGFGCSCDHWLMLASDGTWYDRNESTPRPFVCEAIAR